ncbi:unnamed protein product [Symbiodinium pilosum]|uniref:Secreted protein n=1 Tax=Symbiodinium pilosum TaxID=2952 RepID=A0A812YF81_SYMPI|nr:unnamed protein product [Symbiodinium pilosum]
MSLAQRLCRLLMRSCAHWALVHSTLLWKFMEGSGATGRQRGARVSLKIRRRSVSSTHTVRQFTWATPIMGRLKFKCLSPKWPNAGLVENMMCSTRIAATSVTSCAKFSGLDSCPHG